MNVVSIIIDSIAIHLWWAAPLLAAWFIVDSAWFKGKVGEWAVNQAFKKHLNPEEYTVLHDVTLPLASGTTQIDHIVLSRYGIHVIETKNYSGWIFGDVKSRTWTQTFHAASFGFKTPYIKISSTLKQSRSCFSYLNLISSPSLSLRAPHNSKLRCLQMSQHPLVA